MLPQKQRIPKALAREIFARGVSNSTSNFLLKTSKSPDGQTRFAVSISKKVAPTAVLRNRTRRRVYEVIRVLSPKIKRGFLAAFSVKKGGEKLASKDILREIEGIIKRAGLLIE